MYVYMHLCMYVRMYVCMYACMYVRTYVCMYVCIYVCKYVCMYVHMYVCMYVCMFYVCMYVCIYMYVSTYDLRSPTFSTEIVSTGNINKITRYNMFITYLTLFDRETNKLFFRRTCIHVYNRCSLTVGMAYFLNYLDQVLL